jgi:hypothetical protein
METPTWYERSSLKRLLISRKANFNNVTVWIGQPKSTSRVHTVKA